MVDALFIHFQHVETDKKLLPRKAFKIAGDLFVALAFVVLHRLGGGAVQSGEPRFDLAKNIRLPVLGDKIRLAEGRFVVLGDELVAELF